MCAKETRMLPNKLPNTIVSFTPSGQRYEVDLSKDKPEAFAVSTFICYSVSVILSCLIELK